MKSAFNYEAQNEGIPTVNRDSYDGWILYVRYSKKLPKLQRLSKASTHLPSTTPPTVKKMSPSAFARASPRITSMVSRRAFHATRARLSSPYHYPEGPYSNLPFNTKTRFFAVRYWLYCITGFFAPFGIAGMRHISFLFLSPRSSIMSRFSRFRKRGNQRDRLKRLRQQSRCTSANGYEGLNISAMAKTFETRGRSSAAPGLVGNSYPDALTMNSRVLQAQH
ncbi:hypothetical protein FHL15_004521 [Xylaria flabelliformis]|uniref:Cytochrome c oxidase subunit 8, mitochondrial n=1 Tax=Xylaria flabelliformis TaxID=2512241 RepID=A0A553I2Z1_9PEZI|nr:hypothetical protein FHL15_004521 [Xylaria flabelliformis]